MGRRWWSAATGARAIGFTLVGLIALAVFVTPSVDAASQRRSAGAAAAHALRARGYRTVHVTCTTRGAVSRCAWHATRRRRLKTSCSGVIVTRFTRARGYRVRVGRHRCVTFAEPRAPLVLGFNDDPSRANFAAQAALGIRVRRLFVRWDRMGVAPGVTNWNVFDPIYRDARAAGLVPLLVIYDSPCWTRPSMPCSATSAGPPDPQFDSEWKAFARGVAERYPAAMGIEIWNEENLRLAWQSGVDPVRYATILREASDAIHAVAPHMPVISGGLFRSPATGRDVMADDAFLRVLFEHGIAGSVDAIGAHPYPYQAPEPDPATTEQDLNRLRAVRDAAGAPRVPLWITEMGVTTIGAAGATAGVSEAAQAAMLSGLLDTVGSDTDVPVAVVHRLVDQLRNRPAEALSDLTVPHGYAVYYGSDSGFGVLHQDLSPKPAACLLSRRAHGALDC